MGGWGLGLWESPGEALGLLYAARVIQVKVSDHTATVQNRAWPLNVMDTETHRTYIINRRYRIPNTYKIPPFLKDNYYIVTIIVAFFKLQFLLFKLLLLIKR